MAASSRTVRPAFSTREVLGSQKNGSKLVRLKNIVGGGGGGGGKTSRIPDPPIPKRIKSLDRDSQKASVERKGKKEVVSSSARTDSPLPLRA